MEKSKVSPNGDAGKYKLSLASTSWNNSEIEAIKRVIETGFYSMGTAVKNYETEFAQFFGSKFCVMCSSGSTANLLMIASMFYRKKNPLKKGDVVVVPAISWSTTYYPLSQYGLKLRFVDVDPETLNYDLEKLATAVNDNPRLVMAVNLLGNPNDFGKIKKIIGNRPIEIVEDNCESMGAIFENKQCGTIGLMGTFSSFFSHHISTMEGGCVVTDDEELYHILLCLRAHGWTRNLPKQNHVSGTKSDFAFEESYKFVLPGYNVRPLEMSGAIGSEQLKKLPGFVQKRRENAEIFVDLMKYSSNFAIQKEIGQSSWFGFSILIKKGVRIERMKLIEHLEKNGIETRPIVGGNFVKNPVIKWLDHEVHDSLENAEFVDQNGFFVGNHHYNIADELKFLRNALNTVV